MKLLKVGSQVVRVSDHELNILLVKIWGNISDTILNRLEQGKPVIKHGDKWQFIHHYKLIDNTNAMKETREKGGF